MSNFNLTVSAQANLDQVMTCESPSCSRDELVSDFVNIGVRLPYTVVEVQTIRETTFRNVIAAFESQDKADMFAKAIAEAVNDPDTKYRVMFRDYPIDGDL